MILVDTHILVWMGDEIGRLGPRTRERLGREPVAVSAISFWEVAMLVGKGRLHLDDPGGFRGAALRSGIAEIPLDGEMAVRGAGLDGFHGDPADRFIVATAIQLGATLCTMDEKILRWCGPGLTVRDGRD